jgi:hypothetical protein
MPDYNIIRTRRNPLLIEKEEVWKLINYSYIGGEQYRNNDYLHKYPKESEDSYKERKKRAIYFNQIAPLINILVGFIYRTKPKRSNIESVSYIIEKATKTKSLDEFMELVAKYSALFTIGILVDSPKFDSEQIKTEKQRKEENLNPYCVMYKPFQIRDFALDENKELLWLLLDNTYYDNTDPFDVGKNKTVYRLWTRETYQDFFIEEMVSSSTTSSGTTIGTVIPSEEISHGLGVIPFRFVNRFVNWRDDDEDFIQETIFEDAALISQSIYNNVSYMDEMIASGSFKVLMYPTPDGEIPDSMIQKGIGSLSVIPYQGDYNSPEFKGATLSDVQPFLVAIEFYLAELLKQVGFDTDETKEYVKSGVAKKIDFEKVETILQDGSLALEELENWIFQTAAKWENKTTNAKSEYNKEYSNDDIEAKLSSYYELLTFPFKKLKKVVTELIVKNTISGEVDQKELEEVYKEIRTEEPEPQMMTIDQMVEMEADEDTEENETSKQQEE